MTNEIHAPSRHDEFFLLLLFLLGSSLPFNLCSLPSFANSPNARDTEPVYTRPAYPGWSMRCVAPRPHSPLLALLSLPPSPPRLSTGLNNINYARRRGTRARDPRVYTYIYTFAHSGVRQVSNAIINYPTVFCYRACAPPYLSPSPSLCILHSLGIRDSNPCLSISRFFFLQHRKIRIGSLLFRGEGFFPYFLPLFFLSRGAKTSFSIDAWKFRAVVKLVGVTSRVGRQQQ